MASINFSHVIIIPKCDGANEVMDFYPIGLMHSVDKLFMKVLAMLLTKRIDEPISIGQSAFIKVRCIQNYFMYVQGLARRLYRTRRPSILLKLDITKAFDTVAWLHLLDMLHARGFDQH